jgi:hypothetical protein
MQKLNLDHELMERLYSTSARITHMYLALPEKRRKPVEGEWGRLISLLSDLRDYTSKNFGAGVPETVNTVLKHSSATLIRFDKAVRDLNAMNAALPRAKRFSYKYCRDTLDKFNGHFERMISKGA